MGSTSLYALFYYGILSTGQFSVFFSNLGAKIFEFGQNIVSGISNLWDKIQPRLFSAYTGLLGWIIQSYAYLIVGILGVTLIIISYLKRKNLKIAFYKIKDFVIGHKLFFLIVLGLIIILGIIFYLFYLRIVTVEKLKEVFGFIRDYLSKLKG